MSVRGVVAAGHPLTADAGAEVLRLGGNAVDAAVAAVATSFVSESPLTGLGAGGYMLIHTPSESTLLDFFVAAPGAEVTERRTELVPIDVYFTPTTSQVFNVGAASCGVPGTPAGLVAAVERFGTLPAADLFARAVRLAREGVRLNHEQAYFLQILAPILTHYEAAAELYAPGGELLCEGDKFSFPDLADALERLASEGAAPFYSGDIAAAVADAVVELGGTLARADLAAYEPIAREPVRLEFRGHEVLTNPPPSSGGILIVYALELLSRSGATGVEDVVEAMERAQAARTEEFLEGLGGEGFAQRFLADKLGSTTHITAVDAAGWCASVTCSNGTGSGLVVPGTGIHVNNMLGEQDLNLLGYHRHPAGRRLPSMMSPTVVTAGGELVAGLGSGGSNRIRSAILQTVLGLVVEGRDLTDAVNAPRVHFEDGRIQAEPGVDQAALRRLEERGYEVVRWSERNVFFGGVHGVARDPTTGELHGAGDPRRGGAVAVA